MEKNLQNMLLVTVMVLIVAIAAAGIFIFYQQKSISALNERIFPQLAGQDSGTQASSQSAQNKNVLPAYAVAGAKDDLIVNTKNISGKVTGVSGNSLIVEAEVADLSKIGEADPADPNGIPKIKKTFQVAVNNQTQYLAKKLGDIKTGDAIAVVSNDQVLKADNITATQVIAMDPAAAKQFASSGSGQRFVNGVVDKISDSELTLKSSDNSKTYTIKIIPSTQFVKYESASPKGVAIGIGDIGNGDHVTASSADAIGDKIVFEATKVMLIVASKK